MWRAALSFALSVSLPSCGSDASGALSDTPASPSRASGAAAQPAPSDARPGPTDARSASDAPPASAGGSGGGSSAAPPAPSASERPGGSPSCLWELDDLLSYAGAPLSERFDCGSFGSPPGLLDCFRHAVAMGQSVQFTVNNCVDCSILSTYLSLPTGDFRIYRESDHYGDALREVRLESCARITDLSQENDLWRPGCAGAVTLYSCVEPRP